MSEARSYYMYIMTNERKNVLYAGMTGDLKWRVYEHKSKIIKGFTSRYNITRIVYYEEFDNPYDAICREKQIKGWLRKKKEALIRSMNPNWLDLSKDWY